MNVCVCVCVCVSIESWSKTGCVLCCLCIAIMLLPTPSRSDQLTCILASADVVIMDSGSVLRGLYFSPDQSMMMSRAQLTATC